MEEGNLKHLNLIVKADVQGSVEAVKQSMEKLQNEEVKVKVIHAAPGAVNESDVTLAKVSNAIIIAFNVRPIPAAKEMAEKEEVQIIIDEINSISGEDIALKGAEYKELSVSDLEKLGITQEDNIFIVNYKTGEVINKTLKVTNSGKALYIYSKTEN